MPVEDGVARRARVVKGPRRTLTMRRERLFLAITLLLPFAILGGIEGATRLFWRAGALPLFTPLQGQEERWLVTNPAVASRWFAAERTPPSPSPELLSARKPENGFRVFVLGESAAQGFPYPRTGAFSRVLRLLLEDALPGQAVEVVNLGIAATNSYAMLDIVDEVIAQRPDAILYYGGHNEYFGAFGAGSTVRLEVGPRFTRLFLRLQHLRSIRLANRYIARLRAKGRAEDPAAAASFMESVAGDRDIALDGPRYARGVEQFEGNLTRIARRFRAAGIPVYLGSVVSNVRDQAPFASERNGAADAAFADATARFEAGDSVAARAGFLRARDLDVVRFRAPTAFDSVVQRVARAEGATYVPVAEAFAAASPAGAPGAELFLEHVHPDPDGSLLIARTFWESLRRVPPPGRTFDSARVRGWTALEATRGLTSFDERIAWHRVRALTARWPFVPADRQGDHRGTYRPVDTFDSLAFDVSAGALSWEEAKLTVARWYEGRAEVDSALVNYRGLMLDLPQFAVPWELAGRALFRAGRIDEADPLLERAMTLAPSVPAALMRAEIATQRKDWRAVVGQLRFVSGREPTNADVLYRLSLAQALAGDGDGARATALRLARLAPRHPQLRGWLRTLGLAP